MEQSKPYRQRIDAILDTSLTVSNLHNYTNVAIDSLIDVMRDARGDYLARPTIVAENERETEDLAANYFGIGDVNVQLDSISKIYEELQYCQYVLDKQNVNTVAVLVPPGNGSINPPSEEKMMITQEKRPKTAAVLFLLSHHFGLNIDPAVGEVHIIKGKKYANQFRNESYVSIDVPNLERVVVVCDEERNITYVFDTKKLTVMDITPNEIAEYDKDRLHTILEANPQAGVAIPETKNYIKNIGVALGSHDVNPKFLRSMIPIASAAIMNIPGLSQLLDVDYSTVARVVHGKREAIGPIGSYLFGKTQVRTRGFTVEQQQIIIDGVSELNITKTVAPEGVVSISAYTKEIGVGASIVRDVIAKMGDELGEVRRYRFGYRSAEGIDTTQQEIITAYLKDNGLLASKALDGTLSFSELQRRYNISPPLAKTALKSLGISLDELPKYQHGPKVSIGLSGAVVGQILAFTGGQIAVAPEGSLTSEDFAKQEHISRSTLKKMIDEHRGAIGILRMYRMEKTTMRLLDKEQQVKLRQIVESENRSERPEGYESIRGIAIQAGVTHKTIARIVRAYHDELGDAQEYRFRTKTTEGYSPSQIAFIRSKIKTD